MTIDHCHIGRKEKVGLGLYDYNTRYCDGGTDAAGQEGARLGIALQQDQISVYEVGNYIRYKFGRLPKWERYDE